MTVQAVTAGSASWPRPDRHAAPPFQYRVHGTPHIVMGDGTEFDAGPGDVTAPPQGHDAWFVGDQPVNVVD
ncbi:MAG TPA: hypothetical protein VFW16_03275 [Streptosporangiaceae bacterium]|nr:hypothetical protein [Streptosporangiaceae bacterium]